MTVYFIDIKGYFVNGEFAIKELCLISDPFNPFHKVYKILIPKKFLGKKTCKTNDYMYKKFYQLDWDEGKEYFCSKCTMNLNQIAKEAIIYVADVEHGTKMKTLKKNFPNWRFISFNKTIPQLPKVPSNISCPWRDHGSHCAYLFVCQLLINVLC